MCVCKIFTRPVIALPKSIHTCQLLLPVFRAIEMRRFDYRRTQLSVSRPLLLLLPSSVVRSTSAVAAATTHARSQPIHDGKRRVNGFGQKRVQQRIHHTADQRQNAERVVQHPMAGLRHRIAQLVQQIAPGGQATHQKRAHHAQNGAEHSQLADLATGARAQLLGTRIAGHFARCVRCGAGHHHSARYLHRIGARLRRPFARHRLIVVLVADHVHLSFWHRRRRRRCWCCACVCHHRDRMSAAGAAANAGTGRTDGSTTSPDFHRNNAVQPKKGQHQRQIDDTEDGRIVCEIWGLFWRKPRRKQLVLT